MELTRASFIALGSIAFAVNVASHGWPKSHGAADWIAGALLLAMVWWLLGKRRNAGSDAEPHQDAGKGFAFRLGKALNGVRRGFSRRA